MSRSLRVAASLAAALALTSCGPGGEASDAGAELDTLDAVIAEAERSGAVETQLALLRDGDVSQSDLYAGFENWRTCLAGVGMEMDEPRVNPVDGWRLSGDIDGKGVTDPGKIEEADACQNQHMTFIELGYEITNVAQMEPTLMAAVQTCLRNRDVEVSGTERNMDELLPEGGADEGRAQKVVACVNSHVFELFPDADVVITY